jgi:outer membrane lipopolysaccharide assembly protein LptE/RlpB
MMWRGALVALSALLLGAGCGYSWRGTLPEHIRTVGIPVFANRTQWPNIETALTAAVASAFATDGRLKVVNPSEADAILEGEIVNYQVTVLAFDSNANPQQYRLFVTVNVSFRDVRRGVMLFEQRGLQERVDYLAAPVVADTIARQDAAIGPVATILARDIVARAVDPF